MKKKSSQIGDAPDQIIIDPFDAAIEAKADEDHSQLQARIPPEHGGIQINFCKTPTCDNFGKPEEGGVAKWERNVQARYKVSSAGKDYPHLRCTLCGSLFPMKSNLGIHEEQPRHP